MDDPEREPLRSPSLTNGFQTDEMGPAPDTAFLGLFGEIGSLVSALKKRRRDKDAFFGYERAVLEEVGDVLWYASAFARRGGTSLAEAASRAIEDGAPQPNQVTLGEIAPTPEQPVDDAAIEMALLDLAGEAGDLAHRFKNGAYKNNADAVRGDLVKLLRPLGRAASLSGSPSMSLVIATSRRLRAAGEPVQTSLRCSTRGLTSTSNCRGFCGWRSIRDPLKARILSSRSERHSHRRSAYR